MIFRVFFFLVFFLTSANVYASDYSVDVDQVSLSQFSTMIFKQILQKPFTLSPAVLDDKRLVAVSFSGDEKHFLKAYNDYIETLGFTVSNVGGLYRVDAIPEFKVAEKSRDLFVYKPKFRSVSYIVQSMTGLFEGKFSSQNGVPGSVTEKASSNPSAYSKTSARGFLDNNSDVLIFYGTKQEISLLSRLLPDVDVAEGDVSIFATVYEVQTTKKDGSAFSLALSLLGSKLGIDLATSQVAHDSAIKISSKYGDAVVSALSTDSRFNVVSSPSVRARSGATATFTSGSQVPVLSSSTTSTAGSVTQSIEYRDSGVIFKVSPLIRADVIDLDVTQELSSFVQTTNGVNNTPTLNKRSLNSSLSLAAGDTVVLGGLSQDQKTDAKQGLSFMPSFTDSDSHDFDKTEILLVLRIVKI